VKVEDGMMILRACRNAGIVIIIIGIPIVSFWMGGRFVQLQNISKEFLSEGTFSQIRFMLLCYHEQHGTFPPTTYRAKPDGPVHSWRVLLLPYIDMYTKELYSKYDFSEPWNSPKNLAITKSAEQYLGHFSLGNNEIANYLAIGEGDEWPSKKPLKSFLVIKGKDRFLVVEYPDSKILWMEPKY
jgi:hypothetical protein